MFYSTKPAIIFTFEEMKKWIIIMLFIFYYTRFYSSNSDLSMQQPKFAAPGPQSDVALWEAALFHFENDYLYSVLSSGSDVERLFAKRSAKSRAQMEIAHA